MFGFWSAVVYEDQGASVHGCRCNETCRAAPQQKGGGQMIHTASARAEHCDESSVDLLLKAKSGDDEALERLLARYLPRLRRWTSCRLPMALRTLLDSGDLVQEAIISALPHLKTLEIRTERALWVYLKQVVRYRIIDLNKRSHRRPARQEFPADTPVTGPSPLDAAIGAEAVKRYAAGHGDPYERAVSGRRAAGRDGPWLQGDCKRSSW